MAAMFVVSQPIRLRELMPITDRREKGAVAQQTPDAVIAQLIERAQLCTQKDQMFNAIRLSSSR